MRIYYQCKIEIRDIQQGKEIVDFIIDDSIMGIMHTYLAEISKEKF
jgi:hypothetical protein